MKKHYIIVSSFYIIDQNPYNGHQSQPGFLKHWYRDYNNVKINYLLQIVNT